MTNYILAYSDACPQESLDPAFPDRWYTFAAVGTRLESSPFGSGLVVPLSGRVASVLTIPDPAAFERTLRVADREPFRDWKKIRGAERKGAALERLLKCCNEGKATFFSHSTLGAYAESIIEQFFGVRCAAFVSANDLAQQLGYVPNAIASLLPSVVTRRDLISLGWIARCCCILHKKASESLGNVELLVIHDNLPFDRASDVAVIQLLLGAIAPRRVNFMTSGNLFGFAPADNFAAAAHACITHTDATIDQWALTNGRPSNVYMTMDGPNGTFARYL